MKTKQLYILSLIIALGFLGISLPYAVITPMMISHTSLLGTKVFGYSSSSMVFLGIALCSYPLGQFIGLPVLGAISDVLGRKVPLVISLFGTTIGYFLSAVAIFYQAPTGFLLARLFTGFCEANISISQAAAADLAENVSKLKSFSQINVAVALGYILGPLVGGLLVMIGNPLKFAYSLPFIFAGTVAFIAALIVYFLFDETSQHLKNKAGTGQSIFSELVRSMLDIKFILFRKKIRDAIWVFLLFYVALDLFYEFYPLFFVYRWDFSPFWIAYYSAIYTIPYMLSQTYFVPFFSKLHSTRSILKAAGVLSAVIMAFLLKLENEISLYFTLPLLGIFFSFCSTNSSVIVSDSAGEKEQGRVMGVAQSLRVLNIAIIAISIGIVTQLSFKPMPIVLSLAVILMISILMHRE